MGKVLVAHRFDMLWVSTNGMSAHLDVDDLPQCTRIDHLFDCLVVRRVPQNVSNAEDWLILGSLYFLDHVDAIGNGCRHRLLAKDMVALLGERADQWGVEIILYSQSVWRRGTYACTLTRTPITTASAILPFATTSGQSPNCSSRGILRVQQGAVHDSLMGTRENLAPVWSGLGDCDHLGLLGMLQAVLCVDQPSVRIDHPLTWPR